MAPAPAWDLPSTLSSCWTMAGPRQGCGRLPCWSPGRKGRFSGTVASGTSWSRLSMLLRCGWLNSCRTSSSSSPHVCRLLPSRLSTCSRSSSRTSLRDACVASRSWRNSWWKCRPSSASSSTGFLRRSSTIQFRVVFKVFLPEQNPTAQSAEQLVDIPIHGGCQQGLRPGQGSQRTVEKITDIPRGGSSSSSHSPAGIDDADDAFQSVLLHFSLKQKSARQVTVGIVADTSSWTPAAYERTELVDDNGHDGSFWKNMDTQHSQWHPPWET